MGFQQCTNLWPLSSFPEQKDHPVAFPDGQAYSLPFDPVGQTRHEILAKLGQMNNLEKLVPNFDSNTLQDKAW